MPQITPAVEPLPTWMAQAARDVSQNNRMNAGVAALMDRQDAFSSPTAAMLAGIHLVPEARKSFDEALDAKWASNSLPRRPGEVVIGGGLHAAVYCAVRVAQGHPRPWVIESSSHPGGTFAMTREPAFYLNSRNRPGPLALPGMPEGSLNVLPGALVQPSDLSGDEYESNLDLAWSIRTSLAANANLVAGRTVTALAQASTRAKDGSRLLRVTLDDGTVTRASRVLVAVGLGPPVRLMSDKEINEHERVLTYEQFMARMDNPFPLRGMGRVAVIGGGDSGRTVIESLAGQGPTTRWSVASVDKPTTIDWYGAGVELRGEWEECNRSRYKGIARLLPRQRREPSIVTPMGSAVNIAVGYECAYVDGRPYDAVIECLGYDRGQRPLVLAGSKSYHKIGGLTVGRKFLDTDVWLIGTTAKLPVDSEEKLAAPTAAKLPENATALYRYAGRTAALAAALPGVPGELDRPQARRTIAKPIAKPKARGGRAPWARGMYNRDGQPTPYGRYDPFGKRVR